MLLVSFLYVEIRHTMTKYYSLAMHMYLYRQATKNTNLSTWFDGSENVSGCTRDTLIVLNCYFSYNIYKNCTIPYLCSASLEPGPSLAKCSEELWKNVIQYNIYDSMLAKLTTDYNLKDSVGVFHILPTVSSKSSLKPQYKLTSLQHHRTRILKIAEDYLQLKQIRLFVSVIGCEVSCWRSIGLCYFSCPISELFCFSDLLMST